MNDETVLQDIDTRGVTRITLNRPEVHNAFDDALLDRLTRILRSVDADDAVRVVHIAASGKSFSAGADLNWMRRMADYTHTENLADAEALGALMQTLATIGKPTVAVVQGSAYGGGAGLVACCDIAVAASTAMFCFSEVKLGLIPAVISPYVVSAMGARAARRYFLTAERFDASDAQRHGLVQEVAEPDALEAVVENVTAMLLANGPGALSASKSLIDAVAWHPIDQNVIAETARRLAAQRVTEEGREGIAAFLDKRKPAWIKD